MALAGGPRPLADHGGDPRLPTCRAGLDRDQGEGDQGTQGTQEHQEWVPWAFLVQYHAPSPGAPWVQSPGAAAPERSRPGSTGWSSRPTARNIRYFGTKWNR